MPDNRLAKTRQEYCDHKFVDSLICLKCGKSIQQIQNESKPKPNIGPIEEVKGY